MSIHLEHGYQVAPMDWVALEPWSATLRTHAHTLQQQRPRRGAVVTAILATPMAL